jgi:hypothetical protein
MDNILHLEEILKLGTRSIQVYDIDTWYNKWKSVSLNSANIKLISIKDKTQDIDWLHNGATV